jgi:hypothetical protein
MLKRNEKINGEIADIIAEISFTDFNKIYNEEIDKNGDQQKTLIIYKKLTEYCQIAKANNYITAQTYNYANGRKSGRIFCQGTGLQNIPSNFRGLLSNGIYIDIDAINCHPCLLYKICSKNQIPAPNLNGYINNRNHYLKTVSDNLKISREEAKKLFIMSLNKQETITTIGRIKIKNLPIFTEFDNEMKRIQQSLIERYTEIGKQIMSYNPVKARANLGGCLTNWLICDEENEMLKKVINYIENEGHAVVVPMFDGLMIADDRSLNKTELIQNLNNLTQNENIKWDIKPHNIELLSSILMLKGRTINQIQSIFGNSIIQLGSIIYNTYFKSRLACTFSGNSIEYFIKMDGDNLWKRGEKYIMGTIENWLTKQPLFIIDEDEETTPLNKNLKWVKDTRERIMTEALNNIDTDFIKRLFNSSKLKLNFNNGVFNFSEMSFTAEAKYIDGFFKIPYNFEEPNKQVINDIWRKIINPIFGCVEPNQTNEQMRDYILYKLARMVAGYYVDKSWMMWLGLRDSGKGVLSLLIQTAIGDYYTTCDSGNFLMKPTGTNDTAKNNMWLFGYELNRILAVSEFITDPNNKKHSVNGTCIKQICSGGDYIETRAQYSMKTKIQLQCGIIFMANEMPPIYPENTIETGISWFMPAKFYNPTKQIEKLTGFYYYPLDENIKEWITQTPGVGLAFIHILLKALEKPTTMPQEYETEMDLEPISDGGNIKQFIQFTGLENDKHTTTAIQQHLASKNLTFNSKLLCAQLLSLGAVKCRVGDTNARGYKFIKLVG